MKLSQIPGSIHQQTPKTGGTHIFSRIRQTGTKQKTQTTFSLSKSLDFSHLYFLPGDPSFVANL
jgi:hypothetical protein